MTPVVAVLAGGLGRRVGGGKAALEFRGRALVEWPLEAARAAGLDAVVVAKRDSVLPALSVPVWVEPDEPVHPLCGVVAALEQGSDEGVIVVGCDMPFVGPEALLALAAAAPPAGPEPLLARYGPEQLPALRAALAAEAPLRATFAALQPSTVAIDPADLRNLNTPDDLRDAERP